MGNETATEAWAKLLSGYKETQTVTRKSSKAVKKSTKPTQKTIMKTSRAAKSNAPQLKLPSSIKSSADQVSVQTNSLYTKSSSTINAWASLLCDSNSAVRRKADRLSTSDTIQSGLSLQGKSPDERWTFPTDTEHLNMIEEPDEAAFLPAHHDSISPESLFSIARSKGRPLQTIIKFCEILSGFVAQMQRLNLKSRQVQDWMTEHTLNEVISVCTPGFIDIICLDDPPTEYNLLQIPWVTDEVPSSGVYFCLAARRDLSGTLIDQGLKVGSSVRRWSRALEERRAQHENTAQSKYNGDVGSRFHIFRGAQIPDTTTEYNWGVMAIGESPTGPELDPNHPGIFRAPYRIIECFATTSLGGLADDCHCRPLLQMKGWPWRHYEDFWEYPWTGFDSSNPMKEGLGRVTMTNYSSTEERHQAYRDRALEEERFKCRVCGRCFPEVSGLLAHEPRHDKESEEYAALQAKSNESHQRRRQRELDERGDGPICCPYEGCDETRVSQKGMESHIGADHENDSTIRERSKFHNKKLRDRNKTEGKYICPYTGCRYHLEGFGDKQVMERHMLRHSAEKTAALKKSNESRRFSCRYVEDGCLCPGYDFKGHYAHHMLTHHGEKV